MGGGDGSGDEVMVRFWRCISMRLERSLRSNMNLSVVGIVCFLNNSERLKRTLFRVGIFPSSRNTKNVGKVQRIENKAKTVRGGSGGWPIRRLHVAWQLAVNDEDTLAQRGESSRSITSSSPEIAALTQQIAEMNKIFLRMSQSNQQVNVVNPSCETFGGPYHYSECQAAGGFTQGDVYAATGNYNARAFNEIPQDALPSNTIPNPREEVKVITTRSGMTLAGPSVPPPPSSSSSKEVERDPELIMDQKLHFNISLAEALALMPTYANMLKDLLTNKEKLLELANTPLNENCSAVLLKNLPEKLGDPGKFLIPFDLSELEECMAIADLGASINLMPLTVWKKLMFPEIIPTRMTLELVNQSVTYPSGIAVDVFVQVGKFMFPADFVVIDYYVDPRVPLILGRPFLRTAGALVDVHEENIDIVDFSSDNDSIQDELRSGSTTSHSNSLKVSLFPSLAPFKTSDSLLEEFADELSLIDSFPLGNDDLFDFENDNEEWSNLLYQDPFDHTSLEK
ncbi:reverse transcriptase domain-containing protein, partial [Tanacetum coccineum]